MIRLALLFTLCSVSWLGAPEPGRAQPAPAQPAAYVEPPAYKAAVHSGIDEFDRGNFEEAREHFARAHGIFPNARTLRGLGMSEFELRNYVDSVEKLEQALASDQKSLDGKLRAETEALLARAKAYVGEVYLRLTPASSEVRVDGFPVQLGEKTRVRLAVGDHVLEFSAEGRLDERRALKIRGEQALELVITLVTPPTSERAGSQGPLQRSDVAASAETPLYKRWWLWTSVGALVAGGVVAGVLLSMRDRRVADANGGSTGDTLFIK